VEWHFSQWDSPPSNTSCKLWSIASCNRSQLLHWSHCWYIHALFLLVVYSCELRSGFAKFTYCMSHPLSVHETTCMENYSAGVLDSARPRCRALQARRRRWRECPPSLLLNVDDDDDDGRVLKEAPNTVLSRVIAAKSAAAKAHGVSPISWLQHPECIFYCLGYPNSTCKGIFMARQSQN